MTQRAVFITGSSSGLGRAAAKLFAARGWKVVATMRNPEGGKELADLAGMVLLPLDITQPAQIERAAAKAISGGGVDVVFNNAGYGMAGPLEGMSDEQILRMVNTNLLGAIRTTKAFIPHFREKRAGLFINTTSIGGLITVPFNSIYHATKWALEGWSESMAFELNQLGIGMKTVSPGGMKTDFFTRSFDAGRHPAYDALVNRVMSGDRSEANGDVLHTRTDCRSRLRSGDRRQGSAPLRCRRGREGDLRGAPAVGRRGVPPRDAGAILRCRNPEGSMNMRIALTGPVSAFFEAERAQDVEALARCFSEHATVRDEGRTIEGPDAIKRWMKEAKAKYHHTVEPLAVSHRDGLTVVTARVAGTFPNSPLDLQHVFAVEGGKIASLEIK